MAREVYDPKKPELEFYNVKPPHTPKMPKIPRTSNVFSKRWFMLLYGGFLTIVVVLFFANRAGLFDNIEFFRKFRAPITSKINNIDSKNPEVVVATIEVNNFNYTNSNTIEELKASVSLYNNKKLIFTGNDKFYNVMFPVGQRIGFRMPFDKNYWKKANRMLIILDIDGNFTHSNFVRIRR